MEPSTYFGRVQHRLIPLRAPDKAVFTGDETAAIAAPGIRLVMTHALPFFPAMAVYAALVTHDGQEYVELLDIVVDRDYFKMLEDYPPHATNGASIGMHQRAGQPASYGCLSGEPKVLLELIVGRRARLDQWRTDFPHKLVPILSRALELLPKLLGQLKDRSRDCCWRPRCLHMDRWGLVWMGRRRVVVTVSPGCASSTTRNHDVRLSVSRSRGGAADHTAGVAPLRRALGRYQGSRSAGRSTAGRGDRRTAAPDSVNRPRP
jgi:hypothetical protein